jgi:hypothetical protein
MAKSSGTEPDAYSETFLYCDWNKLVQCKAFNLSA